MSAAPLHLALTSASHCLINGRRLVPGLLKLNQGPSMNLELELKERVARRAVQLLPQPQSAIRLRKLVADPEHSLTQVVDAVKLDPMLAAAVLRIANSVSHSRGEPITSLTAAVNRIGEKELSRLALAAGLGAASTTAGPLLALRRGAMQDALTSALICERLAPEFGLDAESLFMEGLLHDVGRLVALATLELIVAQHPKAPSLEPEGWLALAQTHHIELGGVLSERWGLPTAVCEVIERHHLPDDGARDAASVVRLSDVLLGVLHSGASLSDTQVPWLEWVESSRRPALLEALSGVPELVSAFEVERPRAVSSPLVSTPTPVPAAHGVSFPIRASGGRVGEAVVLSERRLLLRTSTQIPDNYLEKIELMVADEPLEFWVRVTRSSGVGPDGRAEAEATPFAPTGEVARRLRELSTSTPTERAA